MPGRVTQRTIVLDGTPMQYTLERKKVKNVNLHVRKDGSIYVSANAAVPAKQIDAFLISKESFILNAQLRFREQKNNLPKQYISGESFWIQGNPIHLEVKQAAKDHIYSDGQTLLLEVKDLQNFAKRERMVEGFLDAQCREIFGEIAGQIYPVFQKYGIAPPILRIRKMDTRWGSCIPGKGVITINKRLLGAPRVCIVYVVMHEFCHFIHPNHSRQFYDLLSALMPDWKERKKMLDSASNYL